MVIIRFPDPEMEVRALGYIVKRFSGKSFANGDTMVPFEALAHLAAEGFEFVVKGRATYAHYCAPLLDPTTGERNPDFA